MNDTVLVFEGLGFAYRPEQWIIRNYAGQVEQGRVLAILGPNGQGKSTLLKLLLGIVSPDEGHVTMQGRGAFVPQSFDTDLSYTALEMVLMGRARHVGLFAQPSARDESIARQALERLGILDLAPRLFSELSGGQRQMTVIARALASEANILVLDEPTSALDLKNQAMAVECLSVLSRHRGITVVFTTQHPDHALAIADEVLLMFNRSEYLLGPAEALLT
jgi:iron complex transport system ATP-binding protein